jgi:hypothetical protein
VVARELALAQQISGHAEPQLLAFAYSLLRESGMLRAPGRSREITSVRLKVEQNQLVSGAERVDLLLIGPQGA